jgi:hypothetical protein
MSYFVSGQWIRKVIGAKKRAALEALEAVRTDIRRGEYRFKKLGDKVRFDDFARDYLEYTRRYKRGGYRMDVSSIKHLTKKGCTWTC